MLSWKLSSKKWRHNGVFWCLTLISIKYDPDQSRDLKLVAQNLRFSNPNNSKWRHDDVIIVFSQSVYKICQRQPTALKLGGLIVYSKFHKICKFENHVTRNEGITKNNGKCRPPQNQTKYISFERIWWKLSKNVTYWIWATVSKVMGIYVKFYHDQSPNIVMSCDPGSNFRKFFRVTTFLGN